ncbi:MAG: hypothetical protein PVF68_10915 [Acidobacteriota bacterium]|jgi:hypothetical protein
MKCVLRFLVALGMLCQPAAVAASAMPILFEANRGQAGAEARFLAQIPGGSLHLTRDAAILRLPEAPASGHAGRIREIRMQFRGTSPDVRIEGTEPTHGRSHYLLGADRSRWIRNVPHFSSVRYRELYPGIDLVFYGRDGQLEYDFVVAPGADPGRIRLRFRGIDELRLDPEGNLVVHAGTGGFVHHAPTIYQGDGAERQPVSGRFVLGRGGRVRLDVEPHDTRQALFIDPMAIAFSTYSWAPETTFKHHDIAVDPAGAIYLLMTGTPASFPGFAATPGSSAGLPGEQKVFIAKLAPDGSSVVYATWIGGNGTDLAKAIAVNEIGEAVLVGDTFSTDFPVTLDVYDPTYNGDLGGLGDADTFVARLNRDGSDLIASTYLGGFEGERTAAVALGAADDVYVTGRTESEDFPTVLAFQGSHAGNGDAFVARLSRDLSTLRFSTYLGGFEEDHGTGIDVDRFGQIYVSGGTSSAGLATPGSWDDTYTVVIGGDSSVNGFAARIIGGAYLLDWLTYVGPDRASTAIAVDDSGYAHVAGTTRNGISATPGAFRDCVGGVPTGDTQAYVVNLVPDGSTAAYATCLPGMGPVPLTLFQNNAPDLAVDAAGRAYVAAAASEFLVSRDPFQGCAEGPPDCRDGAVTVLQPDGSDILFSSWLGGAAEEDWLRLALGPRQGAHVLATTRSMDFPLRNELAPMPWDPPEMYTTTKLQWALALQVDLDLVSWEPLPLAASYDLVAGDLMLLRATDGDFKSASEECLADDFAGIELQDPGTPAPGQGVWFLGRPNYGILSGSYDSGLSQSGFRDAEADLSPVACAPGCDHLLCVEGEALDPACSSCVDEICVVDPFCCDNAWDSLCVDRVRSVCGNVSCFGSRGECDHNLCEEGSFLEPECDAPPVAPSCVTAICQTDPFCCALAWDAVCVDEVSSVCGLGCQ